MFHLIANLIMSRDIVGADLYRQWSANLGACYSPDLLATNVMDRATFSAVITETMRMVSPGKPFSRTTSRLHRRMSGVLQGRDRGGGGGGGLGGARRRRVLRGGRARRARARQRRRQARPVPLLFLLRQPILSPIPPALGII